MVKCEFLAASPKRERIRIRPGTRILAAHPGAGDDVKIPIGLVSFGKIGKMVESAEPVREPEVRKPSPRHTIRRSAPCPKVNSE